MSLLLSTGAFASSLSGAAPGMVLMKPTSITHSGTSATLGANGQVTFTAVTSLSLNGCFTADFDNYFVNVRHLGSTDNSFRLRLRAAGSDASGSNYTRQYIDASGASISAARDTLTDSTPITFSSTLRSGSFINFYGPALAQPTAFRSVEASSLVNAYLIDGAYTHSLSTAYDGFTLTAGAGNVTGALQVYGLRS